MVISTSNVGKKAILRLHGSIASANSVRLSKALLEIGKGECTEIILDLHQVDYIDSPGLGGIIYAQIALEKINKRITLAGPQQYVKKLFRDCALDKKFEIVQNYDLE